MRLREVAILLDIDMVKFEHVGWARVQITPNMTASHLEVKESLELDTNDINVIMSKAKELQDSGWHEVHIKTDKFTIVYDYIWEYIHE